MSTKQQRPSVIRGESLDIVWPTEQPRCKEDAEQILKKIKEDEITSKKKFPTHQPDEYSGLKESGLVATTTYQLLNVSKIDLDVYFLSVSYT